jgi:hypothetical protein
MWGELRCRPGTHRLHSLWTPQWTPQWTPPMPSRCAGNRNKPPRTSFGKIERDGARGYTLWGDWAQRKPGGPHIRQVVNVLRLPTSLDIQVETVGALGSRLLDLYSRQHQTAPALSFLCCFNAAQTGERRRPVKGACLQGTCLHSHVISFYRLGGLTSQIFGAGATQQQIHLCWFAAWAVKNVQKRSCRELCSQPGGAERGLAR